MFGINLNPIHWMLVGVSVMLVGVSVAYMVQSSQLKAIQVEYRAFQLETEALGKLSERQNREKEIALATAAVNIQTELNNAKSDLDKLYVDYERLRVASTKGSAGSGAMSNLADAAGIINCPSARTGLSEGLDRIEDGVLEKLAKSRDQALLRNQACKKYLDELREKLGEK